MTTPTPTQIEQKGWVEQWSRFKDDSLFLFEEWIYPHTLDEMKDKRVLDAGCGHGHHALMVAPYAAQVVGVDLNTSDIARTETKDHTNIQIIKGDLATFDCPKGFDVVYCIGVIHHTDNPDRTFDNLKRLLKPGGLMLIWAYAYEGNFWNRTLLETMKRKFLLKLPANVLLGLAWVLNALLYPIIWTVYLLPLRALLPYYDYFGNARKLSFKKNWQNIFDKLIAPQTFFLKEEQVRRWFNPLDFTATHISHYKGVSWRCSGIKQ